MNIETANDQFKALAQSIAKAGAEGISSSAQHALDTGTHIGFIEAVKNALVLSLEPQIPIQIVTEVFDFYGLPHDIVKNEEQLTQQIADANLPMVSNSAKGALGAGRSKDFIQGIVELRMALPKKCHEFLGDQLTILLNNHIQFYHERKTTEQPN